MEHTFVQTAELQMDGPVLTVFGQFPRGQNQYCLARLSQTSNTDTTGFFASPRLFGLDLT